MSKPEFGKPVNLHLPPTPDYRRTWSAGGNIGGTAGHSLAMSGSASINHKFLNGVSVGGSVYGHNVSIDNISAKGAGAEVHVGYNLAKLL